MNSDLLADKKPNTKAIFNIKKIKNQRKWTKEEDKLLLSLASKFNGKQWKEISKYFPKKKTLQCFSRYKRIRPGIIKGPWTKQEDIKILELIIKYGQDWSYISKIVHSRNGKQIRDRFLNVLDPFANKRKFSPEEDTQLIYLYKNFGPKWAEISKYFKNRTADMIKNRFYSSIKKQIQLKEKENMLLEVIILLTFLGEYREIICI